MTLWSQLLDHPSQHAAIRFDDHIWTYGELRSRSGAFARKLAESGVSQGSFVGVYGLSAEEAIVSFLACLKLNAVWVPFNDRYPENELEVFKEQVPLNVFVAGEVFKEVDADERLDIPDLPAVAIFTSGSSGRPKAVMLSQENLKASALGSNKVYGACPEDTWLLSLPLYHIGGLMIVVRALAAGGTCAVAADHGDLRDALAGFRPHWISLVPTQLVRLLEDHGSVLHLKDADGILLGGASCPEWLWRKGQQLSLPLSLTYGSSETCAQFTATAPGEILEMPHCGRLLPGRALQVVDGRISIGGDVRFLGYLQEKRLTRPFTSDGWFLTSDLGELDASGNLRVLGRGDEIFKAGGENIAPQEIETVLSALPVAASYIVGPFPNKEYGALPALVVVSPLKPDPKALRDHLKARLPGLKRPCHAYWWQECDEKKLKVPRGEILAALKAQEIPSQWDMLW